MRWVAGALLAGLVVLFAAYRLLHRAPPPAGRPVLLRVDENVALERPPSLPDERLAFREAILRLEQVRAEARAYPNAVETQVVLAQEALWAGDLLTARAACRAALRLGPEAEEPIYDAWGHAAFQLGLIEEAQRVYRALIQRAPHAVRAYLGLYRVLSESGRKTEAGGVLESAARSLRPDDVPGRLLLVNEFDQAGLLLRALQEAEDVRKAAPDSPQAILAEATLLFKMNRLDRARPLLESLVAAHPDYAEAHRALADLLDSPLLPNRDRARAEHHYLEAIRRDPNDPGYFEGLAQICFDQERFRQAAYLYIKMLQITPDSVSARQHLAAAYARLGEGRAAKEQGEIARRLAARNREEERMNVLREQRPTDPNVRLSIARRYAANDRLRKALPELQAAACLGADPAQARRERESLYNRIGMNAPPLPEGVGPG